MAYPKTILCVDDDSDDRFFLSTTINKLNPAISVIEKENGRDALKYLSEAKEKNILPCLVVLDINMPVLDGKKTFEQIRSQYDDSELPVVIFTCSQNPNDRKMFKSKGVEMFTKPMDIAELNEIVKNFLFHCS